MCIRSRRSFSVKSERPISFSISPSISCHFGLSLHIILFYFCMENTKRRKQRSTPPKFWVLVNYVQTCIVTVTRIFDILLLNLLDLSYDILVISDSVEIKCWCTFLNLTRVIAQGRLFSNSKFDTVSLRAYSCDTGAVTRVDKKRPDPIWTDISIFQ